MKKRVLIFGGTGMLGHKLVQVLSSIHDVRFTIRGSVSDIDDVEILPKDKAIPGVDVRDSLAIRDVIDKFAPDIVVNAVGVIKQLSESKDVIRTLQTNSIFPNLVAQLAGEKGFRFITIGTDCVFQGSQGNYVEQDIPDATDLYGRSKQYGEAVGPNCLTLRTSIIGRELRTSHSLIDWFLSQGISVNGYSQAIFSGLPTIVLAELIAEVISNHPELSGLYHVSSEPINKHDLLRLVKERLSLETHIEKDTTVRIDRSLDSSKFREATGWQPLPWPEMIDRMMSDPTPYDSIRSRS